MADACDSFADLFLAAHGRAMTPAESAALRARPQEQINATVRHWVDRTDGAFACEDRLGNDGVTYTAFWRV